MASSARVFIVPGHGNTKNDNWYGWLASELRGRGFYAKVLEMPRPKSPRLEQWVEKLKEEIPAPDKETYFVGHSLGVQAILIHLGRMEEGGIGGALLVAGFALPETEGFSLASLASVARSNWRAIRFLSLLNNWYRDPILWDGVKERASKGFTSIHSSKDPYMPDSVPKVFGERLGSKVVIVPDAGHFRARDGYERLDVALDEFLKMASRPHSQAAVNEAV